MKRLVIVIMVLGSCLAIKCFADRIHLLGYSEEISGERTRVASWVDVERLSKTPSWEIGQKAPLDRDALVAIAKTKYPELMIEDIFNIALCRVGMRAKTMYNSPVEFNDKWFYQISWWVRNEKNLLEGHRRILVVLLDGSIVEPEIDTEARDYKKSQTRPERRLERMRPSLKVLVMLLIFVFGMMIVAGIAKVSLKK